MAKILVSAGQIDSLIRFRGELLDKLVKSGHKVYAIAGDKNKELQNCLKEMGIEYHQVCFSRVGLDPISDLKYLCKTWFIFKKIKPDILFSYTIKPVIYGNLAGFFAGIHKRYALITGLGYAFIEKPTLKWRLINKITRFLYKLGLFFAHGVFFQNHDDLNFFRESKILVKNKETHVVHGSGVNIDYYSQEKLPDEPIFILIARLLKDKGIIEYIDAAKEVLKKYPNTKFFLVGPHDNNPASINKQELQNWIDEGLIHYVGAVDDVREWIKKSSVYVLPSYREGTPRSVLEAMAMGRPIITTDAPGCRETVINGKNGFIIPVKDSRNLANAMLNLIENSELRREMGQISRVIACSKYDVHKVNDFLLKKMHLIL